MSDLLQTLENAVREGIKEGIKAKLSNTGYNSEMSKVIDSAVASKISDLRPIMEEAISKTIGDESFRAEIISETRSKLAKLLVQRFGGEMEKQVNSLKSDPTMRARITLAIEEIVKNRT